MKNIQKKIFDGIEDVAEYMVCESEDGKNVCAIYHYDNAKRLIAALCEMGIGFGCINLSDPEFNCYYDEYLVELFDGEIYCEPAKRSSGYIGFTSDIVIIESDVNSEIIKQNGNEDALVIWYCLEEDIEDDDCDKDNEDTDGGGVFNYYININGDIAEGSLTFHRLEELFRKFS